MKLGHIIPIAALALLAGQNAMAQPLGNSTLNKVTVALTYTTEGEYNEQNINGGYRFEKAKEVLKIGNKQILEMLVDEGRIDTIKGYSIQVLIHITEGASIYETYVVDPSGYWTNISDFLDFNVIYDSDSEENILNYTGRYLYPNGNTIGTGDFSYTGQGQIWLQFYDLFVSELEGTFESSHHWDSDQNKESFVSYTKSGEMSNASGEAFNWFDWDEFEEYNFEGVVKGSIKIALSKDFVNPG